MPLSEESSSNGGQPHRNETARKEDDVREVSGDRDELPTDVLARMAETARILAGASRISTLSRMPKPPVPCSSLLQTLNNIRVGGGQKEAYARPTHFIF